MSMGLRERKKGERSAVFHGEKRLLSVSNYPIKPYIPSVWRNCLDFLALKCDTDQLWSNPVFAIPQMGKTTIKISSAHTDAMSLPVECNGRSDDKVEMFWLDQYAACWLPDAKFTSFKFSVGIDLAKQHFRTAAQYWHENALVCAPGPLDDFTRIDFIVHRQVTADR